MSNHSVAMNRHDATRRVMLAIAVGDNFVDLPFVAKDGTKPLVVTTPNEYLNDVIERVEALGGSANIALAEARKFTIFVIEGREVDGNEHSDSEAMNKALSMGMFWLRLQNRRNNRPFRLGNASVSPAPAREFAY